MNEEYYKPIPKEEYAIKTPIDKPLGLPSLETGIRNKKLNELERDILFFRGMASFLPVKQQKYLINEGFISDADTRT